MRTALLSGLLALVAAHAAHAAGGSGPRLLPSDLPRTHVWAMPGMGELAYYDHHANPRALRHIQAVTFRPIGGELQLLASVDQDSGGFLELDTLWIGVDLGNGPAVVLQRGARQIPLRGQWMEVFRYRDGRFEPWLTREGAPRWRTPKSIQRLPGYQRPLVLAVDVCAACPVGGRSDPPAHDVLLSVSGDSLLDVSRESPTWYEPREIAGRMQFEDHERRREFGESWAVLVLERCWNLIALGRRAEARNLYNSSLSRTEDPNLQRLLLFPHDQLELEWMEP